MGAVCSTCPKPLLPVGDKPLLGHILAKLQQARRLPDTVYVQPHDVLVTRFVREEIAGRDIEFLPCDAEMGPFFWIRNVYRRTDGLILAVYGDFFAPAFDIGSFLKEAAQLRKPLVAAIGHSRPTTQAAVFDVDGTDVRDWTRKPRNVPGDLLNVGCYLIEHNEHMDAAFSACRSFLEDDVFPKLIPERRMGACVVPGEFINVNTPENLDAARTLGEE